MRWSRRQQCPKLRAGGHSSVVKQSYHAVGLLRSPAPKEKESQKAMLLHTYICSCVWCCICMYVEAWDEHELTVFGSGSLCFLRQDLYCPGAHSFPAAGFRNSPVPTLSQTHQVLELGIKHLTGWGISQPLLVNIWVTGKQVTKTWGIFSHREAKALAYITAKLPSG